MTSLPSRAEARVLCANDVFFDLLDRRPAIAGQLAEEFEALALRYLEQHPPRVGRIPKINEQEHTPEKS